MTYPRSQLIDTQNPSFYHVVSRCVRRAWLCGDDVVSGQSYEHRRGWVEQRLHVLSELYAVELYGYAVMSNHYHLVIRVDPTAPRRWCDETVAKRWVGVFPGGDGVEQSRRIEALLSNPERLKLCRERLGNISWFMRCINEPIARRANKEDGCTGRFWEGRFKAQVLLDEEAIYAGMAYVDLNPVRAGIADGIEECDFTSIQRRLAQVAATPGCEVKLNPLVYGDDTPSELPMPISQYIALVRWTAANTPSKIDTESDHGHRQSVNPGFQSNEVWLKNLHRHRDKGRRALGSIVALQRFAQHIGQSWLKGCGAGNG